jgi:tRNA (Thr-GGU) A37 N-methylase
VKKLVEINGEFTGVFASCSPRRPGAIGVTTVRLLRRDGNELRVRGLDALDGTPVLDLKPYAPVFDERETKI